MAKALRIKNGRIVGFDAELLVGVGFTVTFNLAPNVGKFVVNNVVYGHMGSGVFLPGTYTYEASSPSYFTSTGSFTVVDSDITVSEVLTLDPQTSQKFNITVTSEPTGAFVYLNGVLKGLTPLYAQQLPVGFYNYSIAKSGFNTFQGSDNFSSGEKTLSTVLTSSNPASGTYLGDVCVGTSLYKSYANGTGGQYTVLVQTNSPTCGYVAPTKGTVSFSSNLNAKKINIFDSSGTRVFSVTTPDTISLLPGNYTFSVPQGETSYRISPGTSTYFSVTAGSTQSVYVPIGVSYLDTKTISVGVYSTGQGYSDARFYVNNNSKLELAFSGGTRSGGEWGVSNLNGTRYAFKSNVNMEIDSQTVTRIKNVVTNQVYVGNSNCSYSTNFDGITLRSTTASYAFFLGDTYVFVNSDIVLEYYRWSDG